MNPGRPQGAVFAEGRRATHATVPQVVWGLKPPQNVLVVKPSSLGDVVHTLPAVAAVRRLWPGARVEWLVNPEWAPLLRGNPVVDRVWEFPRARFRGVLGPFRLLRWAAEFGAEHPAELVLDFQGLFRSAWVGKCSRAGCFAGISDAREGARFFYDRVAQVDPAMHAVDRYLALASAVGAEVTPAALVEWPLPAGELPVAVRGEGWLREAFVVVHPFSRGRGKSLSREEVLALCEALAPVRVVLAGRSSEPVSEMPHVVNLLNRTSLPELLELLRRAAWTVSVDSGPMHMAAALSSRVVAVHTWSDPARVGPYPGDAWVLKEGRLAPRHDWPQGAGIPIVGMQALADWLKKRL
jgi:heptosyltransferase-1